jgi:3-deoxy-D-manno-octulosonic-acid transferase
VGTVILVDTIGELRDWWGVGQIATVGGSFGDRGGQNMLEPAGYGCAVSFGPNTRNFRVISQALVDQDGAVRVADEAELTAFVARCVDDIPAADSLGRNARRVVDSHRGAIARTVRVLMDKSTLSRAA